MNPSSDSYLYRSFIVMGLFGLMAFMFWALGDAKTPLLLSFVLAYVCFPLISRLEKVGVPRVAAVVLIIFLSLVLLVGVSLSVLPGLISELNDFVRSFPGYVKVAIHKLNHYLELRGIDFDIENGKIAEAVKGGVKERSNEVINFVVSSLSQAFTSVTGFVLALLNLVLVPVFFFFLILDYEKISGFFYSLIPPDYQSSFSRYVKLSNGILHGFFRGQLAVASILTVLYAVGLKLVGLKYGVIIGLISGAISIIPYAGLYLGMGAALVVSAAHDGGVNQLVFIVLVFSLVQTLEGFVITPKLVGGNVGLNAFETILALIIWGNVLGFAGLIAGVPLTAIMKNLFVEIYGEYGQIMTKSDSLSEPK